MQNPLPRSWFTKWREPRKFFLAARRSAFAFEKVDELLSRPDLQYLREAYVAGLFASIWNDYKACQVRLISDRFPDAEVRDDKDHLMFEVVLADKKGREIAKEHRLHREAEERYGRPILVPMEPLNTMQKDARDAIARACSGKVKKYLGQLDSTRKIDAHLLIAANFNTLHDGPVISHEEMGLITEPWRENFKSIWVLLEVSIYRLWPTRLTMSAINDPFRVNRGTAPNEPSR
jgi:hypothetical protein